MPAPIRELVPAFAGQDTSPPKEDEEMTGHIVLFTLREGVAKEDPRVSQVFARLRVLPERIEGIRRWEVGENISDRPAATDFALYSAFDSREDLFRYADHPAHREVVDLLQEVCTWQVCDYVI